MCGICGYVDFSPEEPDVAPVVRVRDRMTLRGPDRAGLWSGPGAALGHRRLSIIDLSPNGDQPMPNEDGTVQVVFNGEIYNFRPLREILLERGHRFRSTSDTECLVHGYEEWGEELPRRLEGMFAIAVWDSRKRSLLLARDRFGEKPLFYSRKKSAFWFASSLQALAPELDRLTLRPQALDHYLRYRYIPADSCIYEQVDRLPPAHTLTLDEKGCRIRQYWGPADVAGKSSIRSSREALEYLENALRRCVADRLVADVPVGVFLSGGVDSSAIAAMTALASPEVQAYHVRIPGNDELPHAQAVAGKLGIRLNVDSVPAESWELVKRVHSSFGEPFADPGCVTSYLVSEMARRHVTVILSGDGGDEVFGGGYGETKRECRYRFLRRWLPRSFSMVLSRALSAVPGRAAARVSRVLDFSQRAAAERYRLKHDPFDRLGLNPYSSGMQRSLDGWDALSSFMQAWTELNDEDPVRNIMWTDIRTRLPGEFLVKVDTMSMAHSLEVRCPFLDSELAGTLLSIDTGLLVNTRDSKLLLKKFTANRLGRQPVYRQKQGFDFKVERALAGEWGPLAKNLIRAEKDTLGQVLDADFLTRFCDEEWRDSARLQVAWRLVCLALWWRTAPNVTTG